MERLAKGLPARFQNDLSLNVRTSNLFMYADDHQVYQSGCNITAVISDMSRFDPN